MKFDGSPAPVTDPASGLFEMVENLPSLLLSVLERRYLSDFRPRDWRFEDDRSQGSPRLRQLLALGRSPDEPSAAPMAGTLAAWCERGQAIVTVLQGTNDSGGGNLNRIYYGARRMPGGSDSDGYLQGQLGSLAAHFPGIELGPTSDLRDHAALSAFLRTAPALAAVTGIPSAVGGKPAGGLERLARSIPGSEFAMVVVAESLPAEAVDSALDACWRLQGEVSTFASRQISRSRGGSESEDLNPPPSPALGNRMPMYLQQCATFFSMACHNPLLAGMVLGGTMMNEATRSDNKPATPRRSRTESWNESEGITLVDAVSKVCESLLSRHVARLQAGRGWGWWRTAVYIVAESETSLQAVGRSIRAVATGDASGLEPLRIVPAPPGLLRDAILSGRVLTMRPAGDAPGHPLGEAFDSLGSCLNSEELSVLVAPPRKPIPGLAVRDRGEFGVTAPTPTEGSFDLGRVRDSSGDVFGPVPVTARALNEHVLIVGTPGSGKTNTCMNLLINAHDAFRVPFLVIEPAKAEYRRLAAVMGGRLRVYTVGGSEGVRLRLNPLSPVPGASLMGHIDLVKAVFNASFAMHPGMPQILEQALYEVYEERGWDLVTGENETLGLNPLPADEAALTPCLADLHDQVEVVMLKKGYGGEVRLNLGAALRSRLHGLTLGAKGLSLNVRRSTPPEELFNAPAVLELQHLRDDEEKAFVMAIVFLNLYQYCETRQRLLPDHRRERLQHLTLIEEAHRLLTAPRGHAGAESADPSGKAVGMFTDMLAELRALGEGFLIAEQIPSKLAPETVKNTNLKIIHRLTSPAERAVAGQSANLTDRQSQFLATLSKGLAVVHGLSASPDDPVAEAVLVQVRQVKGVVVHADGVAPATQGGTSDSARRHGGCKACAAPCEHFHRVEPELRRARSPGWFRDFVSAMLSGHGERCWEVWSSWRSKAESEGRSRGDVFCLFVHAARDWTGVVRAVRGASSEGARFRPPDRLIADRLAGEFGVLARDWLEIGAFDGRAQAAFVKSRREILQGVQGGPPPDLPGCHACPARCRMLPWVAPLDLARASALIAAQAPRGGGIDAFGNPGFDPRWSRIQAALAPIEEHVNPPSDANPILWWRDWRYCLVNLIELPPEIAARREEILGAALQPKSPPGR